MILAATALLPPATLTAQGPDWAIAPDEVTWTEVAGWKHERDSHSILREAPGKAAKVEDAAYSASIAGTGVIFEAWGGEAVTLKTRSIRCAGIRIQKPRKSWSFQANTGQRLLRAGTLRVVEHLSASSRGLTWAWQLESLPAACDLILELSIDGLAIANPDGTGRALEDPRGAARCRISTPRHLMPGREPGDLPTTVADSVLTITVPGLTKGRPGSPSTIVLEVLPEFELLSRDAGKQKPQGGLQLAFDGKRHLAVWQEGETQTSIRAMRFSPVGEPLDRDSRLLSPPATLPDRPPGERQRHRSRAPAVRDQAPAVAGSHGTFLAAWSAERRDLRTLFATVIRGRDGAVISSRPLLPWSTSFYGGQVAVAGGERSFLVVWVDGGGWNSEGEIRAIRVGLDGEVLDLVSTFLGEGGTRPTVAYADGIFVVGWMEEHQEHQKPDRLRPVFIRVGGSDRLRALVTRIRESDGKAIDETPLQLSRRSDASDEGATIAVLGDVALMAWSRGTYHGGDILARGIRISSGEVLGERPVVVGPGHPKEQDGIVLAAGHGRFLLAYRGRGPDPMWASAIDPHTLEPDALGTPWVPGDNRILALSANPQGFLLGWSPFSHEPRPGLRIGRLSSNGRSRIGARTSLPTRGRDHFGRALAHTGEHTLVVVDDGHARKGLGLRLDSEGRLLQGQSMLPGSNRFVPLSGGGPNGLSADRNGWLWTWMEDKEVRATRVDAASGQVLDGAGVRIGSAGSGNKPSSFYDGKHHLVVWIDLDAKSLEGKLLLSRIDPIDGRPTEPDPYSLTTLRGRTTAPSLALSGSRLAVAWVDTQQTSYRVRPIPRMGLVDLWNPHPTFHRLETPDFDERTGLPDLFPLGEDFGAAFFRSTLDGLAPTLVRFPVGRTGVSPFIEVSAPVSLRQGIFFEASSEGLLSCWSETDADDYACARVDAAGRFHGPSVRGTPVLRGARLVAAEALDETRFLLLFDRRRGGITRPTIRLLDLPRIEPLDSSPLPAAPVVADLSYLPPEGQYDAACAAVGAAPPHDDPRDETSEEERTAIVEAAGLLQRRIACPVILHCANQLESSEGPYDGALELELLIGIKGGIAVLKVGFQPGPLPRLEECVRLGLGLARLPVKLDQMNYLKFSLPLRSEPDSAEEVK